MDLERRFKVYEENELETMRYRELEEEEMRGIEAQYDSEPQYFTQDL